MSLVTALGVFIIPGALRGRRAARREGDRRAGRRLPSPTAGERPRSPGVSREESSAPRNSRTHAGRLHDGPGLPAAAHRVAGELPRPDADPGHPVDRRSALVEPLPGPGAGAAHRRGGAEQPRPPGSGGPGGAGPRPGPGPEGAGPPRARHQRRSELRPGQPPVPHRQPHHRCGVRGRRPDELGDRHLGATPPGHRGRGGGVPGQRAGAAGGDGEPGGRRRDRLRGAPPARRAARQSPGAR